MSINENLDRIVEAYCENCETKFSNINFREALDMTKFKFDGEFYDCPLCKNQNAILEITTQREAKPIWMLWIHRWHNDEIFRQWDQFQTWEAAKEAFDEKKQDERTISANLTTVHTDWTINQ